MVGIEKKCFKNPPINTFMVFVKIIDLLYINDRSINWLTRHNMMKPIVIDATNTTPAVYYGEDNKLVIKGRSIPENATKFYQPMINWAGTLEDNLLNVEINLEFMNSASSKKLLYLLKVLDANNYIKKLTVNWYYEEDDEETLEQGQIFEELMRKAVFRYHECK